MNGLNGLVGQAQGLGLIVRVMGSLFFFTHTHCILFLQEINRLTPSIVHG